MTPKPVTIDFETYSIEDRPQYPPKPIGVAIKPWGKKAVYYAFGHNTGNNCGETKARKELEMAWCCSDGLLFQNGKFDIDVAEAHWGFKRRTWQAYHDTMLLLFLDDPNQKQLGLKPAAERLLGMKPEEKDIVGEWLVKNQPVAGTKISLSPQSDFYFMKYLAWAPGDLVGKYAIGDVNRTEALFKLLHPRIVSRGMEAAYDRERRLMLNLLEIERQGVRIDDKRLAKDVKTYGEWHNALSNWIHVKLGNTDVNLDSGAELVDAMIAAKVVDVALLGVTPKSGKPCTDKESLMRGVTDKQLLAALRYRTQLGTCLRTFMQPWLATAKASGGLIYTSWNQVKSSSGGGNIGARTGRLSSHPNFQNIPNEFKPAFAHEAKGLGLPVCPVKGLPPMPRVRSYVIPWSKTDVLIDRDYSQQEPRILAHFGDGELLRQYKENPWIDFHDNAKDRLEKILNRKFDRKKVKNINLGIIYGQGLGSLSKINGSTVEETKDIKNAILAMYPELKFMYNDMRLRAATGKPIRTWGGREYYCEPPAIINGKPVTFDYKMVNTLIQGSAAECTKEAIIRYMAVKPANHRLLLTVHDELLISAPAKELKTAMEILRTAMEGIEFDVPMLSEGSYGKTWDSLKNWDRKGKRV